MRNDLFNAEVFINNNKAPEYDAPDREINKLLPLNTIKTPLDRVSYITAQPDEFYKIIVTSDNCDLSDFNCYKAKLYVDGAYIQTKVFNKPIKHVFEGKHRNGGNTISYFQFSSIVLSENPVDNSNKPWKIDEIGCIKIEFVLCEKSGVSTRLVSCGTVDSLKNGGSSSRGNICGIELYERDKKMVSLGTSYSQEVIKKRISRRKGENPYTKKVNQVDYKPKKNSPVFTFLFRYLSESDGRAFDIIRNERSPLIKKENTSGTFREDIIIIDSDESISDKSESCCSNLDADRVNSDDINMGNNGEDDDDVIILPSTKKNLVAVIDLTGEP
ncbi:hypothetical protein HDU92_003055 [Lobulomyces angularis]|nr:hypothetical protein HDU92_003055 [Lobulomyces angularis]